MTTAMIIWIIGASTCMGFLTAASDLAKQDDTFTDAIRHFALSAVLWPFVLGVVLAFMYANLDPVGMLSMGHLPKKKRNNK